jgi:hypothetical protein
LLSALSSAAVSNYSEIVCALNRYGLSLKHGRVPDDIQDSASWRV